MRLLVWQWGRRGSGPKYALELYRALSTLADTTVFLSLSRQYQLFAEVESEVDPAFAIDTYHDVWSAAVRTLDLPFRAHRLARIVRARQIDVALCAMPGMWDLAMVHALRANGVPYLAVIHDPTPHSGEGLPLQFALQRALIRRAACRITLTAYVAERLQACGLGAPPLWTIPHGAFHFMPASGCAPAGAMRSPFRLLFFGRLLPYKGIELLLRSVRLLRERAAVELRIVGSGRLDLDPALLANLPSVRIETRWVDEGEIASLLQWSDAVVTPYVEASQSGVIPAAFAVGRPVICTPVGGLVEQVTDGETGVIAADTSAEALASAAVRLIGDEALYRRCAEGAAAAAGGRLSWTVVASNYRRAAASIARSDRRHTVSEDADDPRPGEWGQPSKTMGWEASNGGDLPFRPEQIVPSR